MLTRRQLLRHGAYSIAAFGLVAVAGASARGSHPELPVDWASLTSGRDAIIQHFNQIFGR